MRPAQQGQPAYSSVRDGGAIGPRAQHLRSHARLAAKQAERCDKPGSAPGQLCGDGSLRCCELTSGGGVCFSPRGRSHTWGGGACLASASFPGAGPLIMSQGEVVLGG